MEATRLRPSDRDALRAQLRRIGDDGAFPVVFGGEVHGDRLRLTEFRGTATGGLHNLDVCAGKGLGGRVMAQGCPVGVADYGSARNITHDYDRPVLAEGIFAVIAVPVRVAGRCRAVLYGAIRQRAGIGDRARAVLVEAGDELANELAIRDEVDRRVAMAESASATAGEEVRDSAALEELRSVFSELRSIAADTDDSSLRNRIYGAAQRIADVRTGKSTNRTSVRLSRRETDVLAQVALGCTNAETANRLSLAPETVKAYLRSAMNRLDAHTRHEAVVRARSLWLLP